MKSLKKIEIMGSRAVTALPFIYPAARSVVSLFDSLQLNRIQKGNVPLFLVYQQGRVGSTAVYNALARSDLDMPLFHIHTISDEGAERMKKQAIEDGRHIDRNIILSKKMARTFQSMPPPADAGQKWRVLTVFRDPIAIMLSLKIMHADEQMKVLGTNDAGEASYEILLNHIKSSFEADDPYNWEVAQWIDQILSKELDIDPFATDFDYSKGYAIAETEKVRLALLKFERMRDAFNPCVEDLVGHQVTGLELAHENVHRNRDFDEAHTYLKANLRLSEDFCNRIYSTRLMQRFYSDSERNALIERWTKP